MRAKLLDSHKITTIEDVGLINRRNVLMGSGLCAALVIGSPFIGKNESYAQLPNLINALLTGIALAREIWKIFQPTEGQITIVNRHEVVREGDVVFQVSGSQGIENFGYFSYRVPPRYQNTYAFDGGPYGTFSGQKDFTGRTARGQQTTQMYVEGTGASVTASRIFAGPNQYPPKDFAAYGILAFRARPSSYNHDRYMMICEAYATALPHASELALPRAKQMVTVWPLTTDDNSTRINQLADHVRDICQIAVDNYGLVISQQALKDAELVDRV